MQNNLRVIHFSTGHLGGAGLAARRLNQGLIKGGVDSIFHAFAHPTFNPVSGEASLHRSIFTGIISKVVTYLDLKLSKKVFFSLFNQTALNIDFFTPYKDNNTILYFHNFFNLTSQQTILKLSKIGFNVVVTLHDQRLFTGGCHYAFECEGFESVCKNCPQAPMHLRPLVTRNMGHVRELAATDTRIFLIAPSKWMQKQMVKSQLVPSEQVRFIPNSLGPNFLVGKQKLKEKSKSGRYTLGIASMDLNSFIKGGDFVNKLRAETSESHFPLEFVSMQDYKGKNAAKDFWESIDCLLVLSRADNSPNVIHEAKSFGIPVLGSALGGITELMDPDFDYFVENSEIRAEQVYRFLQILYSSEDFIERQARMSKKFNDYVGISIEEHINFYNFVLQSPK